MKVTAIVGSLRKGSLHRQIMTHYQQLCADQFELKEGPIAGIPVYNADLEQPDSVRSLAQEIASSKGVIFFTPEYNYSVPGGLKNAIDWLSRCDPQPLNGKPVTIVGASPGNVGTARMQYHLRQIGVFLDMRFMNKPEVMIGQAMQKVADNKVTDAGTVEFLQKHAGAFKSFCETV